MCTAVLYSILIGRDPATRPPPSIWTSITRAKLVRRHIFVTPGPYSTLIFAFCVLVLLQIVPGIWPGAGLYKIQNKCTRTPSKVVYVTITQVVFCSKKKRMGWGLRQVQIPFVGLPVAYKLTWPLDTESMKWFIEDQVVSLSYDLAPLTPPPHSPISKLSFFLSPSVRRWSSLLTEERKGERGGGGAKSYYPEKAWSCSLNTLLLLLDTATHPPNNPRRSPTYLSY